MRLPTIVRRAVVGLLIVAALAFSVLLAVIHGGQRLLQHRAERLHDEVVALQIHPGSFADIQRMEREWGRFAHYDGVCTREHCVYGITLEDTFSALVFPGPYFSKVPTGWYRHIVVPLRRLGYRSSLVHAELRLHNDRMWGEDLEIVTETFVAPGDYPSALILRLQSGPRLFSRFGSFSANALRRGYGVAPPGACTGCISLNVFSNPNAPAAEVERLSRIDMSCLSRWRGCNTMADLVPEAEREYDESQKLPETVQDADWNDCSPPLDRLALEADNAVLVEVARPTTVEHLGNSSNTPDPAARESYLYHLRIVDRLKNAAAQQPGKVYDVGYDDRGAPRFLPGVPYLFFFPESREEPSWAMELTHCSVFRATEQSLQAVKAGAAKDLSGGEKYWPLGW